MPAVQQRRLAGRRQYCRLMDGQYQTATLPAYYRDGLGQGRLTRLIETDIGFAEHGRRRSSVQHTGQANVLAPTAEEASTVAVRARAIALR